MINGICNKGFGVSAGFDIWVSFCFGSPTIDVGIGKPFTIHGAAFPWPVAVADVLGVDKVLVISIGVNPEVVEDDLADILGVDTVLVISIGVNPEVVEDDFFFSGTALLSDGGCDLSVIPVVLIRTSGISVREELGSGLGSTCFCAEA
jgi:hypothetical protein